MTPDPIRPPVPPVGAWTTGRVVEVDRPTEHLVRIRLDAAGRVPGTTGQLPGQHYLVRLRAQDDYTAQRSYSIASDPDDPLVELMVERLPDGEVSGYLYDELRVDDVLEVRGPVGGWFTWDGRDPSVALAGGSGVVPIVSMLRHASVIGLPERLRVIAVARTWRSLPYADELTAHGANVRLTREDRPGRPAGPIELDDLAPLVEGAERAYVCGSVGFASYAVRLLGEAGMRADAIRVEQFGPTGS